MWLLGASAVIKNARRINYLHLSRASISTNSPDPRLIVLNPRQAGLVKAKPRRPPSKRSSSRSALPKPIQITPLDMLDASEIQSEPVVSAIHSQRPESSAITRKRFDKIRDELAMGFKKSHLEDYLKAQKVNRSLYKRLTKPKMAQFIMTGVWNCFVRDDGQDSGAGLFTENIIELSEQELVLVLGENGRLLREWSKSGARIAISPYRCQIIVNSTQDTFDWINACLSYFLETVMTSEIDITELKKLVDHKRFPDHLTAIQQLTDTYFRIDNTRGDYGDSIVVYSAGANKAVNISVVKRMLAQLAEPAIVKAWKPTHWWFDVNSAEHANTSAFQPFDDIDSLEWTERMREWSRWEHVKSRNSTAPSVSDCQLKQLATPEFDNGDAVVHSTSSGSADLPLSSQLENVVLKLLDEHPVPTVEQPVSTTLTITPGYVLHTANEGSLVPNAGTAKTFCSNIPWINNFASTLPLYTKDIKHDESSAPARDDTSANNTADALRGYIDSASDTSNLANVPNESLDNTGWNDILNIDSEIDDEGNKVFASRQRDLDIRSNLRLIQMKFVANPEKGIATTHPPIEAWAELPPFNVSNNSLLQNLPRVVAVPVEASAHISLPGNRADFKATVAHTYPVEMTQELEDYFMKHCRFGRVGPIEIKPELKVKIADEEVSYLYHSAAYVTLAELDFRNNLLQLSQVEGGKIGGRKIEASLIEHAENSAEFDKEMAVKKSVRASLALTDIM